MVKQDRRMVEMDGQLENEKSYLPTTIICFEAENSKALINNNSLVIITLDESFIVHILVLAAVSSHK